MDNYVNKCSKMWKSPILLPPSFISYTIYFILPSVEEMVVDEPISSHEEPLGIMKERAGGKVNKKQYALQSPAAKNYLIYFGGG